MNDKGYKGSIFSYFDENPILFLQGAFLDYYNYYSA